jgi:uncharacterized protein with HEPN domain
MSSDDLVYVGHMLDMARKAQGKAQGTSRGQYDADENLRIALAHIIQVIGEAARKVSQEYRDAHPEIPWKAIVGIRHKVMHHYLNTDEDVVWQTASQELPVLVSQLQRLLPDEAD